MKIISRLLLITLFIAGTKAFAYDYNLTGIHVTLVEASYVPNFVTFQIDRGNTQCPAGTFLTWNGQGSTQALQQDNVKAAYALLLTAKASGQTIQIFGNYSGCTVSYLYLN